MKTLLALLLLIPSLSWGKEELSGNNIGHGRVQCSTVLSQYDGWDRLIYNAYITGAISGMLIESSKNTNFDSSIIINDAIDYCKKYPQREFMRAIHETFLKISN